MTLINPTPPSHSRCRSALVCLLVAIAVAFSLAAPHSARADACIGRMHISLVGADPYTARAHASPTRFEPKNTYPGPAIHCFTTGPGVSAFAVALSTQGTAALCTFDTTGGAGPCQLRAGDGLPVELLQFGVE
jgi:hypothetical protein